MKIRLRHYKCILVILLIGLLITNCSKRQFTDPPAGPGSPVGEYDFIVLLKQEIIAPGTGGPTEFINSGCDLNSTIKFNSNSTFSFVDNNDAEDENCSSSQIITGNWVNTDPISGGFYGDLSFEGNFRGHTMYNGGFSSSGINNYGGDAKIYFDIIVNNQTFRYSFYFEEI